jgi:enoyl-CoA hydratase/carnithine racemase
MPGLLTIEPRGAVALVTLQRPDKRNIPGLGARNCAV